MFGGHRDTRRKRATTVAAAADCYRRSFLRSIVMRDGHILQQSKLQVEMQTLATATITRSKAATTATRAFSTTTIATAITAVARRRRSGGG